MNLTIGRISGEYYATKSQKLDMDIHLKRSDKGLELSISAGEWNSALTDYTQCGQMQDTIKKAWREGRIKLAIPYKTYRKLMAAWDHYHLNGTNAGCIHQDAYKDKVTNWDYSEVIKIPEFAKCPVCGYVYGSAWLYREIPDDVVQFIKSLGVQETKSWWDA